MSCTKTDNLKFITFKETPLRRCSFKLDRMKANILLDFQLEERTGYKKYWQIKGILQKCFLKFPTFSVTKSITYT